MQNNASPAGEKRRPIIFRAFDTKHKVMLYGFAIYADADHIGVSLADAEHFYPTDLIESDTSGHFAMGESDWLFILNEFVLQQFTGLLDKNGKEIFEGDILSFVTQRKRGFQEDGRLLYLPPVKFGRICVKDNSLYVFNAFHIDGGSIQYTLSYDAVVAGNIYEHPNLLTPQTPTNG